MLIFQICCHVFFLPTIPKGHFSECAVTAIFPETLLFQQWAEDHGFFSYSGMGEVFVLRCILNPAKNYTLLRKRIHIRIVQPKKNTLKIMIVFSFSHFGYLCCFIEGYPKTRWWCQTNVSNFHFVGKGNPSWRTRICFKWVGEKPPTKKGIGSISPFIGVITPVTGYPYFRQFWRVEVLVCLHLGSCILVKNHQLEKWHNRRLPPTNSTCWSSWRSVFVELVIFFEKRIRSHSKPPVVFTHHKVCGGIYVVGIFLNQLR